MSDDFKKQETGNNRVLAIFFMQTYNITSVIYQGMAKVGTNSGVGAVELCFVRTFINFMISLITVKYSGKHVVNDVPKELRKMVFLRSIAGLLGFTCMVLSLQFLPIFISQIVFNTAPFWTAILGFFMLGTSVSSFDIICMLGCFLGVAMLILAKSD